MSDVVDWSWRAVCVIAVLFVAGWVCEDVIETAGEQKRMEIRLISAEIKSFMKPAGEERE